MKLIYSVILILCYSTYCRGQVELKNGHDSILLTSRATADEVLHYFESLKSSKILYSLDNVSHLIILYPRNFMLYSNSLLDKLLKTS